MFATVAQTVLAHPAGAVGSGFGWLLIVIPLFWVAVFVALFAIFGRRWRRAGVAGRGFGPHAPATRSAESTLAQRFANGDIEEIEYRARLEVLRANRYPSDSGE
jgi:putative membrane protein